MRSSVRLWLALGNPGERFDQTRHNAGFLLADAVARARGVRFRRTFRRVRIARSRGDVFAKPTTYMNRCGEVLPWLMRRFVTSDPLVVVVDNLDLPVGEVRMKRSGSAATHNGLRSIESVLGTRDFARLYLGIGRPSDGDVISHVLGRFTEDEQTLFAGAVERAVSAILETEGAPIDRVIDAVNRRRQPADGPDR